MITPGDILLLTYKQYKDGNNVNKEKLRRPFIVITKDEEIIFSFKVS